MNQIQMKIAQTPVLGALVLIAYRARIVLKYLAAMAGQSFTWLLRSRETTNLTYALKADNQKYLASLIADITGQSTDQITEYFNEVEQDPALKQHIQRATRQSDLALIADATPLFGRRIGWYALVRAIKPKIVVETGVDKGLGACVLAAALKRNSAAGHPGHYYGTDINPQAGYLLSGEYAAFGSLLIGDSIDSLKRFDNKIDIFINDSDHSADYEDREYRVIASKLSAGAIILGDNAHCTDKLFNFSMHSQRHFIFFQEQPANHWYPGAGIGFSFFREIPQSL